MTLGRGSGHSPKMRSEDDLGSSDVVALGSEADLGSGSEAEGRSGSLPSALAEDAAAFLGPLFLRLILLLKWSLCWGSWGPLLPGPFFSSCRSSAVGTHTMAWRSGLPLDRSDRRTHTRLIPCAARNDVAAKRSRGGTCPTRHGR